GGFGGGQGGGPGGFGNPGGNPFGGFNAQGGKGGGFAQQTPSASDPNQTFDFLARNRGFFYSYEQPRLQFALDSYLQQKGIYNGQVTRDVFTSFVSQMSSGMGGRGFPGQGGGFANQMQG